MKKEEEERSLFSYRYKHANLYLHGAQELEIWGFTPSHQFATTVGGGRTNAVFWIVSKSRKTARLECAVNVVGRDRGPRVVREQTYENECASAGHHSGQETTQRVPHSRTQKNQNNDNHTKATTSQNPKESGRGRTASRPLMSSAVGVKPASRYSVSPYFSTKSISEPGPVIWSDPRNLKASVRGSMPRSATA
jgi:hypothetical protein